MSKEKEDLSKDHGLPSERVEKEPKGAVIPGLPASEVEKWRTHLLNGHAPYRRECKQCVEGAGLGHFHKRVKYPRSFALSVDLFGPVPVSEAGRDETCVTRKNVLRYQSQPSEIPSVHPQDENPADSPVESPLLDPSEFPAVVDAASSEHPDAQQMKELLEEPRQPVEQAVLRYFVPMRTKTGLEVSEALQQMILGINQRFPHAPKFC